MDINIQAVLTQALSFIILVVVLKKFAWSQLLEVLDKRKETIKTSFEDIENTKQELEASQKEYEQLIEKVEDECRIKLQEAINEGKTLAAEVRDKAREDANQMLVKAKQDIELETEKARIELRGQLADLVIAASENVLKAELNENKNKDLVHQFLDELSGSAK